MIITLDICCYLKKLALEFLDVCLLLISLFWNRHPFIFYTTQCGLFFVLNNNNKKPFMADNFSERVYGALSWGPRSELSTAGLVGIDKYVHCSGVDGLFHGSVLRKKNVGCFERFLHWLCTEEVGDTEAASSGTGT